MSWHGPLSAADYAAVLAMLERAVAAEDRAGFGRAVCASLLDIVGPCVSVSYTESSDDATRAAAVIVPEPTPEWFAQYQPVYEAHMTDNPVLALAMRGGGVLEEPTDWHDADPSGSFRSTPLYQAFYSPIGIHSQLVMTVPVGDGGIAGIAINRDGTPFSAREREILAAASPLLGWAHRHVAERAASMVRPAGVEFGQAWKPADATADAARTRLVAAGLTARQADVVLHVATGATNRQIARALAISPETVRKHLENAYAVLGVNNRVAAAALALGAETL
jgi:DNA-binding CsgD family transcriptional regulator